MSIDWSRCGWSGRSLSQPSRAFETTDSATTGPLRGALRTNHDLYFQTAKNPLASCNSFVIPCHLMAAHHAIGQCTLYALARGE